MTLRLILTRHAKSDWSEPTVDDHDRPLNKRGRRSADAVGLWLAEKGVLPGQALVSTAARTRQTWARISQALVPAPGAAYLSDLYHGEPEAMLTALRGATEPVVMMVGHNPGTAFFARAILAAPPADARFERYPTGATTVIDFDADTWHGVTWGTGALVDLAFARDLI